MALPSFILAYLPEKLFKKLKFKMNKIYDLILICHSIGMKIIYTTDSINLNLTVIKFRNDLLRKFFSIKLHFIDEYTLVRFSKISRTYSV